MASEGVYSPTTAPNPKSSCFSVPSQILDLPRFFIKLFEVLLSFVAFVQEEVINSCISCIPLYFFEFVSCTAFLFTLLLLILLSTPLHQRVGISCWTKLDFCYTAAIALLFIISSFIFTANNSGTTLEKSAVAFGFLASFTFVGDLIVFYRSKGLPFRNTETRTEPANGGPAASPAEAEKLTENGA